MYILKNAVTSIVRNKGRNVLIGIIILVISCSTAVTLAIHNSATTLIDSYKNKYDVEATLSMNRKDMMGKFNPDDKESSRESMQEAFKSANNISVDDVKKYGDSSYVKSYSYTSSLGVNAVDLEAVSSNDNSMGGPGGRKEEESSSDFKLTGYSSIDDMSNFIDGTYKISDGSVFTDFSGDDCIINNELATLNDLKVGDSITVTSVDDSSKTHTLKITGIYSENSDNSEDNGEMKMFSNSCNTIITNNNVVSNIGNDFSEDLSVKPTFILKNSSVVSKFESELKSKGLSEYLSVSTNLDQVEQSTSAIKNLASFAITFLVITLIIGIVVLLFINMINIRERKYEIGVLRTIGMPKTKVALQFMSELLIVSCASLMIGAFVGSLVSVPVANSLLANEIKSSETQTNNINDNFGGKNFGGPGAGQEMNHNRFNGVNNVQKIKSIKAVVSIKVLGELMVIGLIITLISGVSALVSIERFSPLTILKERS